MHRGLEHGIQRVLAFAAPAIALALLLAPAVSHACSQCLATRTRENQLAFIGTTVFLSIMPLLVVGGIGLWLRKKVREADARREPLEVSEGDELGGISRPAPIA